MSWLQVYGMVLLYGIGFTMSLFIGLLAYVGRSELETETEISAPAGSIVTMALGALVLPFSTRSTQVA